VVICLVRGADLHIAQLMPLPLTVSCSSKIQIGFTFLVPAHLGSPRKGPLNGCVCSSSLQLWCIFQAEDVPGSLVLRMYEAFGSHVTADVTVNFPVKIVQT